MKTRQAVNAILRIAICLTLILIMDHYLTEDTRWASVLYSLVQDMSLGWQLALFAMFFSCVVFMLYASVCAVFRITEIREEPEDDDALSEYEQEMQYRERHGTSN